MDQQYKDLISSRDHRTDPFPTGPWVAYQKWEKVLFLHWCLRPELLQPFIPPELEPDIYEGWAWVSAVVFHIEQLHARGLPPLPYLSQLKELNVRTYVHHNNTPGILFLDLEADKGLLAASLKLLTGLPYHKTDIEHNAVRFTQQYRCRNSATGISLDTDFVPTQLLSPKTTLDVWLTERYYSYYRVGDKTFCLPVHHPPWPLRNCVIERADIDIRCCGQHMTDKNVILSHYADEVEVLAWRRHAVRAAVDRQTAGRAEPRVYEGLPQYGST